MFLLDQAQRSAMARDTLTLKRGEQVGFFFEVMKSIGISTDEVDQSFENIRRHLLPPDEPGADAIKRPETPFDYAVFML
jgi:hypothetical protein